MARRVKTKPLALKVMITLLLIVGSVRASLVSFGKDNRSTMSELVGIPTAIASQVPKSTPEA